MCIYCGTNKYRKIYEHHFGKIPKENNGRSYEVHHLDGKRYNNHPNNLRALKIQDHYNIHFVQGDYAACLLIGRKMNLDPEILRKLNSEQNLKRVRNGTHHLLSGKIQSISSKKRAAANILGFQNPDNFSKACAARDIVMKEKLLAGTWILQNKEFHKKYVQEQIANGTHCSQIKIACEHCKKIIDSANYHRSHGNKCTKLTGLIRKIAKHPPRKVKTCHHCNKILDASNYSRYHGDKCKFIRW